MDVQIPAKLRVGSAGAWHGSAAVPPPDGHGGLAKLCWKGEQSSVLELSLRQNFILEMGEQNFVLGVSVGRQAVRDSGTFGALCKAWRRAKALISSRAFPPLRL